MQRRFLLSTNQIVNYAYSLSDVMPAKRSKTAFTLTEVLLAVAIVGIISAIVIPAVSTHYQEKNFSLAKTRVVQAVSNSVDTLVVNENTDFFKTYMYQDSAPESYDDYSGKFLKKYFKISKFCGDNGKLCFAPLYYEYKDKDKKVYTPDLAGSCAQLKDGVSICVKPQIGETPIQGIIDLNGQKGPNVFGRDLVTFELPVKTRLGFDTKTANVNTKDGPVFDEDILECYRDPYTLKCCQIRGLNSNNIDFCCGLSEFNEPECCEYNGITSSNHEYCCGLSAYENTYECCQYKTISSIEDPCCDYQAIYDSNSACKAPEPPVTPPESETTASYSFSCLSYGTDSRNNYWIARDCKLTVSGYRADIYLIKLLIRRASNGQPIADLGCKFGWYDCSEERVFNQNTTFTVEGAHIYDPVCLFKNGVEQFCQTGNIFSGMSSGGSVVSPEGSQFQSFSGSD